MVLFEMLTLIASLAILSKSSSIVVENLVKLSKFFGISHIAIGFILLSASTTLPELSVSIVSSSVGKGAIAAGNVFGSNIANILLLLGFGGFFYGLMIKKDEMRDIAIVLVLTTIVSSYIIFNSSVSEKAMGFLEGIILIMLFLGYIFYIFTKRKKESIDSSITKKEAMKAFLLFCVFIILIFISTGFVVESSLKLARLLHIAESFIGATIIAVGTSLPEISICLEAIRRRHYGIAFGNAIGANIFNLTFVLGTAAVINPISVLLPVFIAALLFAIVANILLFYIAAVNRCMGRWSGLSFLLMYALYIITIFYLQFGETTQL